MDKFSSDKAERLYAESLEGTTESIGSVDELGWFGAFPDERAILTEDSQGFVGLDEYGTDTEYQAAWSALETMYAKYDADVF
jgi:hypothetical protein